MNDILSQSDQLARRFRLIRKERFGEDAAGLAGQLNVPVETWRNYERGVAMPAEILLKLIDATGVSPRWLLTGDGDCFALSLYSRLSGNH